MEDMRSGLLMGDRFALRGEDESLFINPTLAESEDRIFIPCGVGNTDNGFFIYGIKKQLMCSHRDSNIYALIYNYLVRCAHIHTEDIPKYIQGLSTSYGIDYRSVYRFAIIFLQMIHHNVVKGNDIAVNIDSDEEREYARYAIALINDYAERFGRLSKSSATPLKIVFCPSGVRISLTDEKADIYVVSNEELRSFAREMWYGRKINYQLSKADKVDLEYILSEISPFDGFREGQFEALSSMLASRRHAVCIMPTGSGKSLIYYLASLLQPLPLFIVAPTEILIKDQIRNLRKFHHMDNVAHLMLTEDNSFDKYEIYNSLNYVTPMTLQNRHLHVKFRHINNGTKLINMRTEQIARGPLAAYVVLDEIHCLSNWGHDFQPEYLMLSRFLTRFLDRVAFWGFTATADYTVVDDIQRQLNIPEECFYSPINFEKYNVTYNFQACSSEEAMYAALLDISKNVIARNQRTLIFTKSDEISLKVAEVVGYEADIFSSQDPAAYHHFADGKCKVLIASGELGVGINLPDVRCIIHFGLPLSKNEYVQELGRAGRAYEKVTSYVLFLSNIPDNVPEQLLKRNTSMDEIPGLVENLDNDYGYIYRRLTNNSPSKEMLYGCLMEYYATLEKEISAQAVRPFPIEGIAEQKNILYMLYTVGYINDWYTYSYSKDGKSVDILIDITASDHDAYRNDPQKMFRRMQQRLRDYFEFLGNDREGIAKANRAKTIEELIWVYVNWYYTQYLYHHNEQFLDLFDFINDNTNSASDSVTTQIKDYFVLPFMNMKSDEAYYNDLGIGEITEKISIGIDRSLLSKIERINSNRYSLKLDYLLFCGSLKYYGMLDESRLARITANADEQGKKEIIRCCSKLYDACGPEGRLSLLNYIEEQDNLFNADLNRFVEQVYKVTEKDEIYFGIISWRLNRLFV